MLLKEGKIFIEKQWCVYVHIFPNGKKYFGITSKAPRKRWENGAGYSQVGQPIMYNAIQKYGWENIEHKILFENLTLDEARVKEQELIAKFKTNCCRYGNDFGYNMTDGGEGTFGHKAGEKVAQVNRNRLLGKKGKDCPNSRPVICEGIEYESLTQFKEMNGNPKGNIQGWLNGKVGMPEYWYNKKLQYKDIGFEVVKKTTCINRNKKVMVNDIVFNTLEDCAEYLGITAPSISLYLNGSQRPPKEIIELNLRYEDEEYHEFKPLSNRSLSKMKCSIDGRTFSSCKELADYLGLKKNTVWAWLTGRNKPPKEYINRNLHRV